MPYYKDHKDHKEDDFKTSFVEMVNNIEGIRGERYCMMLVTIFNIWGLGILSEKVLDTSLYAEAILSAAIVTCITLYLPDGKMTQEAFEKAFKEVEKNVYADLTMLIAKKQEFTQANKQEK